MKSLNRISSLFLMGFAVVIFYGSLRLGIGSTNSPGAGFLPMLASVLVFALSSWGVVKGHKGQDEKKTPIEGRKRLLKPAVLVVAILGYSFLLNAVGYLISAFLLSFIMFCIPDQKKWHRNILIAVVVAIVSYLIFRKLLGVQLPKGILRI